MKFNRLDTQGERMKLKLKKVCEKQYENVKDISTINIEKAGKKLCEQANCSEKIDDEKFKRCSKCRAKKIYFKNIPKISTNELRGVMVQFIDIVNFV